MSGWRERWAIWSSWLFLLGPFLLPVIAIGLIIFDGDALQRCVGHPVTMTHGGRGAGYAGLIIALVCSPYLLVGGVYEILLFLMLWGTIPLFIFGKRANMRDEERRAVRRERDRQRRAEKRAKKEGKAS
jgi:hypothetical protein